MRGYVLREAKGQPAMDHGVPHQVPALAPALRKPTSSSQAFVQLSPELNFSSLFSLPFQHPVVPNQALPSPSGGPP